MGDPGESTLPGGLLWTPLREGNLRLHRPCLLPATTGRCARRVSLVREFAGGGRVEREQARAGRRIPCPMNPSGANCQRRHRFGVGRSSTFRRRHVGGRNRRLHSCHLDFPMSTLDWLFCSQRSGHRRLRPVENTRPAGHGGYLRAATRTSGTAIGSGPSWPPSQRGHIPVHAARPTKTGCASFSFTSACRSPWSHCSILFVLVFPAGASTPPRISRKAAST